MGRDINERKALFKSLIYSLFNYGTIETTDSKAKAVRGLVDKVINLAKDKKTQSNLQRYINAKPLRSRLIEELMPKLKDRNSGYTSLVRLGRRQGDNAMMVKMSLIGNEALKPINKETVKKQSKPKEDQTLKKKTQPSKTKVVKKEAKNK